jgi:glutathione peroxidase
MNIIQRDASASPFDLTVELADGRTLDLHGLKDKPLLVVNTATRCGLAPQFESLERLHRDYGPRGLTVLGVPSNQFANQEPEADQDLTTVCRRDHGVTFALTRKTLVNGPETHPVIALLKNMAPGFLGNGKIKWNFTKFLVWPDGRRVRRYSPTTSPDRIRRDIERLLA